MGLCASGLTEPSCDLFFALAQDLLDRRALDIKPCRLDQLDIFDAIETLG